jgi:hypothetical protein
MTVVSRLIPVLPGSHSLVEALGRVNFLVVPGSQRLPCSLAQGLLLLPHGRHWRVQSSHGAP